MRDDEELSGTLERRDAGEHVVQFYSDDAFLMDRVGAYVVPALRRGDSVVVIATAPHRAALELSLSASALPVAELRSSGRLRLMDAQHTLSRFMVGDVPDDVRFRAVVGRILEEARAASRTGHVRGFGEMVDILMRAGQEAALLRLEQLWQEFVDENGLSLLCAYAVNAGEEGHGEDHEEDHEEDDDRRLLEEVARRHSEVRTAHEEGAPLEERRPAPRDAADFGELLHRATEALIRAVTPEDIANVGLDVINRALRVQAGSVWLVSSLDVTPARDDLGEDNREIEARVVAELRSMPQVAGPATAEALRTGRTVFLAGSGGGEVATAGAERDTHGGNVVSVPMLLGGSVLGSMNFGLPGFRRLSSEERAFMQAVVDQCSLAFERTRLFDAERRTRAEVEARQAEMALLYRLMEAVNRSQSLEDVFGPALDAVTAGLRVERAAIMLPDADGVMRFRAWRSVSETHRQVVEARSPRTALEVEPAPLLIEDVEKDHMVRAFLPLLRRENIRSMGMFPLAHRNRWVGKLMIYSERPRALSRHEIELTQTIAAQVSQALARAGLLHSEQLARREAERQADRTRRLQRVTAGLSGAATIADLARVVVTEGRAATNAISGAVWFVDETQHRVDLIHSVGYDEGRQRFESIPLDAPLPMPLTDVVRTGEPIWIHSKAEFAGRYPELAASLSELPAYAIACLPMKKGADCIGVLSFGFDRTDELDDLQCEFLRTVAQQGALALERAVLFDREKRARAAAELAQNRATFRAQASAILASSLDSETILSNVAKLAVPGFADWCAVELGEPPAPTTLAATEHVDPTKVDLIWRLTERYPLNPCAATGAAAVVRSGQPELHEIIDDDQLAARAINSEHLSWLRSLGLSSVIHAALSVHDRTIGLITFVRAASGRRYDAGDLETAVMLAQRAAFAVENSRLHRELQRAVRARDDLIAMVSHDLRNLMGIISVSAASIQRGLPPGPVLDKHGKQAEAIGRGVKRMDRLIKDLLDVGSIESGQLKVNRQPEEVHALLSQALEDLQLLASSKGIRLHVQLPSAPTTVSCDRQRIFQVLSNIVGNAIKFTPGGGSIHISAEASDDAAVFAVRDSGPGIEAGHLSRVFDRYYQANSRESSGMGLGLFIAQGIVEAHGGRIWVESRRGEGSSFFFTIALSPAAAGPRGQGSGFPPPPGVPVWAVGEAGEPAAGRATRESPSDPQ